MSVLNLLCAKGFVSLTAMVAASLKLAAVAVLPFKNCSALYQRHGLCATPPEASLASTILLFFKFNAAATDTSAKA